MKMHTGKTIVALAIALILTSCSSVPVQHTSPLQFVSPLAEPIEERLGDFPEPLPLPQEDPFFFSAPKLYFPNYMGREAKVVQAANDCGWNQTAQTLALIILTSSAQQRTCGRCNATLTRVAQMKAEDMVKFSYFSHITPDGIYPNAWARLYGFSLPSWYPDNLNNIESLATGYHTPQRAADGFYSSARHAEHVYGVESFFRNQCKMGFGYAEGEGVRHYVVMSAP